VLLDALHEVGLCAADIKDEAERICAARRQQQGLMHAALTAHREKQ